MTTIIAIEIAIGALRKPNANASVSCAGAWVPVVTCASDIHFRLYCLGRLLAIDRLAGEARKHFLRGFRRHRLELRAGGLDRLADLRFGGVDLDVEFLGRGRTLPRCPWRWPAWPLPPPSPRRPAPGPCGAPRGLGLVGLGPGGLGRLEVAGIFFSRSSTVDWIFGSIPRPMAKKMIPKTTASQKSCDHQISGSWVKLRHGLSRTAGGARRRARLSN